MKRRVFQRVFIGLLVLPIGCAPTVPLWAGWYFAGEKRELHVAVYNWGSETLKNTTLVVNEDIDKGWKYPPENAEGPLEIPPREVVLIPLTSFKQATKAFPSCQLPMSLKVSVKDEKSTRSKTFPVFRDVPAYIPTSYERECNRK